MEAIQTKGLRVVSVNNGDFTVWSPALKDTTRAGEQELVLFTVKMYDNAKAIELTRPMVGSNTIILTLQNGVDNGNQLAEALGEQRIMVGCAYLEGRIKEPGVVTQAGPGAATFGELNSGITDRCLRLLEVFREAGWRAEQEENMTGMLLKTFVIWRAREQCAQPAWLWFRRGCSLPKGSPSGGPRFGPFPATAADRPFRSANRPLGYSLANKKRGSD